MNRMLIFASRNSRELLRDPLNLAFGIGFPVVLLLLLSAIQANIPVSLFEIENLSPGIAVFGFSFVSLFSGTLISKDRITAFLMRLYASPLTSSDFISGYTLPLIPMAFLQACICYVVSFFLGLAPSLNVLLTLVVQIPAAFMFIGIGLLAGSFFNDKQVSGICGALLTNVSAWLSGTWFDLRLVGGAFEQIAYLLPFAHAVDAGRAALSGNYASIMPHLWWVIVYAGAIMLFAIIAFRRKMNVDYN